MNVYLKLIILFTNKHLLKFKCLELYILLVACINVIITKIKYILLSCNKEKEYLK